MTQEATPVGGEATPVEPTNAADVFEQLARDEFGIEDEQDEEPAEGEPSETDSAEEADDDTAAEEEADDLPPIEAPVSWDAEAKAKFAELPRELQETVTKREAEREKFVQSKSQEAAQAKQTALQQAQAELAQISAQYAQQLQTIASSITAEEPDPMLQVTDPIAYAQQMRAYRQAEAQRSQAQQTAMQHAQQAQQLAMQVEQQNLAEQHRMIVEHFPEYADPTTGPELQRKLTAAAKRIGYSDELIGQARASDIIAMRAVAELADKADKYDALQKTKMQKVREAKGKPPVSARPGVAQPGASAVRNVAAAKEVLMTSKNRDEQGAAFMQIAKANGWVS